VTVRPDYITQNGIPSTEERTAAFPESVAIVGDHIVSANAKAGSLSVFMLDDLEPLGDIELGGSPVRVLAVDGNRLAVSLDLADKVVIVDLEEGRVTEKFDARRPDGLCLSNDGLFLVIVSNTDAIVQIRSIDNWAVALRINTDRGPGACLWLSEAD